MNRSVIAFVVVFFMMYALSSCLNDKADEMNNNFCDTTYYAREIKPIFETNCTITGCHVIGGAAPFVFTMYSVVFTKKVEMKYRINLPLNDLAHMPQGDSLPIAELAKLNKWLDEGAIGCD